MARIAGVNIPTNKRVIIALQYIHGIGPRKASEIMAKVGIPVLAGRNTATTLAIELAKSLNITLIGYIRTNRFLVYTGSARLTP